MIVTFCGHRNITERETVKEKLSAEIFRLFVGAEHSNTSLSFYCGGYGEFDRLSEQIIEEVRRGFPTVSCEKLFITPYITPPYKERNDIMKERFDGILYPPIENVPYRFAIIRRNEWMVDKSDLLIAYVKYSWGGAARTLEYARRKQKRIVMI